uniref:Putative sulfite exporter TauE/SafE family protein n=1 Tax=viral metagenome TaxID=1070528 RepID=A0A6M3M1I6_9ZZZZ
MSLAAFIMAGLFCGFIDACLGMGFGVTSTTVLVTFGVVPAVASASVHTAEAAVDIISAISHWKLGNVDFKLSRHLLLPGVTASVLGAVFLSGLNLKMAKPFVQVGLMLMGLMILYEHISPGSSRSWLHGEMTKRRATVLGFVAAFIDVAVGGGWGPLGTPALILSGEDPRKAVGVIEFTEPIISLTAVLTFGLLLGFENFMWDMTLPMILGGVILTPVASYLTSKMPKKILGILIGLWLVVLNVWGLLS